MKYHLAALLCLALFLGLRFLPHWVHKSQQQEGEELALTVPEPVDRFALLPLSVESALAQKHFADLLEHPWIARQHLPCLSVEMARDLELFHQWSSALKECGATLLDPQEILEKSIALVEGLEREIPFSLPAGYYKVLSLVEGGHYPIPYPYRLYSRLYLGDYAEGFPFYCDVRVFDLPLQREEAVEALIAWHLHFVEGEVQKIGASYIIRGQRNPQCDYLAHGFTPLLGERGLFIAPYLTGDKLFLAYAEGPWEIFSQYLDVFTPIGMRSHCIE